MKLLLLLVWLLQEPSITFPSETIKADTPKPSVEVEKFTTEEWYSIESTVPLLIFDSPAGVINVEEIPTGTRLRGKFAGKVGTQTITVESPFFYVLEGQAAEIGRAHV